MSEKLNKIEMGKQYKTRDGRPVRVLCVDRASESYPVVAIIPTIEEGGKPFGLIESFTSTGFYRDTNEPSELDLVECRPRIKRTVWVNVYANENFKSVAHHSAIEAKESGHGRIACVQVDIDVEEGHGLA